MTPLCKKKKKIFQVLWLGMMSARKFMITSAIIDVQVFCTLS